MSSDNTLAAMAEHLAGVARSTFTPEAYTDLAEPGHTDSVAKYLQAASWECAHLTSLLQSAAEAAGSWAYEPGSLWDAAMRFRIAIDSASSALQAGDVERVAREFTAVALRWHALRGRQLEIDGLQEDVQLAATRKGEERAEAQLKALATAGERPKGVEWRAEAVRSFNLTDRAARRVWDTVAQVHPQLSSTRGKPKTRRA